MFFRTCIQYSYVPARTEADKTANDKINIYFSPLSHFHDVDVYLRWLAWHDMQNSLNTHSNIRNRFGWSDFSDSFTFATSNQDTEMRDLSVTHYIASSGDIIFHSHYFVKIISIVVLFKILSV